MRQPGLHDRGRDWGSFPDKPAFGLALLVVAAFYVARNPHCVGPKWGIPAMYWYVFWIVVYGAGLVYWWKHSYRE